MKTAAPRFSVAVLLMGCLACAPPAAEAPPAAAASTSGPEIVEPWAQVLPGMGAVYLSIRNASDRAERLVSVEAAWAKAAEMHESVEEDGVMRMVARPEGFEIPAGGTLDLAPGGKHVMLVEPQVPEGAGSLRLTLRFERAGAVEVDAELREPGGMDHAATEAPATPR